MFLADTERMLLVSCMDVDDGTPACTVPHAALSAWLSQRALPLQGGPVDTRPRAVSKGKLASSQSVVFVSLLAIHALVSGVNRVCVGESLGVRLACERSRCRARVLLFSQRRVWLG